ncbi:MAG: riboflavin synthase [Desulfuromonadales bacterium]
MFTGLIEDLGSIRQWRRSSEGARLSVACHLPMHEVAIGDSIAVNGVCLTVVACGDGLFSADVSPETLQCSTLGALPSGAPVNLERALRLSDRLGGHLVTGHIDAVATVRERTRDGNAVRFIFDIEAPIARLLVEKGSVAIDGISLTVNTVDNNTFALAVIPHTLQATTLRDCQAGTRVNIETDLIGKYVDRLLRGREGDGSKSALDLQFLAKHNFL